MHSLFEWGMKVKKLIEKCYQASMDNMSYCQSWNMQGHKRECRKNADCYQKYDVQISNYITEFTGKPLVQASINHTADVPLDLKDYITKSIVNIDKYIKELAELNIEFAQNNGIACGITVCFQKHLEEYLYRLKRRLERYNDVGWMMHDIYVDDYHLHEEIRMCEEKAGFEQGY